jgi:hypothetical protein
MLLLNEAETNEDDVLPLLEGCLDLPFCDEPNGPYYMGGVGGGLGLGTRCFSRSDILTDSDITMKIIPITMSWTL